MTGFDYARARATAAKLIARFGQASVIRRQTNSGPVYDPVIIETDHACVLVALEYDDDRVDGTLIRRTDKRFYISTAGIGIDISESDKVVVEGVEYSIVPPVKVLRPATTTILYEVQGRK